MSRLFNRENNTWEFVDDADVTPLVASGKYGFAQGLDVPVVSPDGRAGTLPSEQVESAFREGGFRWATAADKQAQNERANEQILEKHFGTDQNINAGTAGVLRGYTLGASDAIMPAAASLFLGDRAGEEVKSGLRELKHRNALVSAIGEGAGAIASPVVGGVAKELGAAGEGLGLGTRAAEAVPSISALGDSANVAKAIVEAGGNHFAGSALEGAYYGLGDGISEAALGDPNDVAEHIAAGTAFGGIFGGLTGAGFGALKGAAPYLKKAVGATTDAADEALRATLQKSTKAVAVPSLLAQGKAADAEAVSQLIDMPEFRDAVANGKEAEFRDAAKNAGKIADQYRVMLTKERGSVADYIHSMPEGVQQGLNDALEQSHGDLDGMLKSTYATHAGDRAVLAGKLESDLTPTSTYQSIVEQARQAIDDLKATGEKSAISRAKEMQNVLDAHIDSHLGSFGNNAINDPIRGTLLTQATEGQSVMLGQKLRDLARISSSTIPENISQKLESFSNDMTDTLHSSPEFGSDLQKLDHNYDIFDKTRQYLTNSLNPSKLDIKQSVFKALLTDPEKAAEFDTMMNHIADVAPEWEAVKNAGRDLNARAEALRNLQAKVEFFRERGTPRTYMPEDLNDIVQSIAPGNMKILDKIDKIKNLEETFQNAKELGPVSKSIALMKAMGQDVAPDMQKLAEFETGFSKLKQLRSAAGEGAKGDLVWKMSRKLLNKTGFLPRMGMGASIGHMIGGAPGAVLGAGLGYMTSPTVALNTLTRLEALSQKTARAIDKGTTIAIDALTKPGFDRAAVATIASAIPTDISKSRENFKKTADYIASLRNPSTLQAALETQVGNLKDAPQVSAAVGAHFAKTANFLADKVPSDPLAHTGLVFGKSYWQPSDFQLATFNRYLTAAQDPMTVLHSIASGSATSEQIETLKAVYPQTYKRLQDRVLDAIMNNKNELSYHQKLSLGTLFGVSADATMRPNFVSTMQQQYSSSAPQGSATPPSQAASPHQRNAHISINPNAMSTSVTQLTSK